MEGCSLSDRHQNCYGTYSFLLFFIFVSSLFSPMTSYIVCLVIYHHYAAIVFCLKFTIFWHFFLFEYHKRPYYVGYVYIFHKFCWKRTNDLIIFRNWIQIIELSKESENEKTTVSRFWKACKYITIKIKKKHE